MTAVMPAGTVDLLEDDPAARLAGTTWVPKVAQILEPARERPTSRAPQDTVSSADLAKAVKRLRHTNDATLQRVHTLRLLMAGLEGVVFDEAARLLSVPPRRLARWLQETETIPSSKGRLLADLFEMLRLLHQLVPREHTGRWLRLPIPALDEVTPYEALVDGRVEDVLRVTQRYAESSFG
ncbi:MAG: hypothetical protein WKF86_00865 [Acidimicrobiales bacterium]